MSKALVVPLKQATDLKTVGGKARALNKLMDGGFNVPDGFVISTISFNNLSSELKTEILDNFDRLGAESVAVRSSAVAEDGAKDAWAGQFDSFLNVERDELPEAIEKCWASAESLRAKAYAKDRDLQSGNVAVIIQKMIPAQIAGVAFSVHPVLTGKNRMVIEAVRGLGEQLVSGVLTPDTYILDRQSFGVVDSELTKPTPIIGDLELVKLAKEIIKIEELFGFPVDVEWAIANGELYILQSRPITTLGSAKL